MCERSKDDFITVYKKTFTKKDGFRADSVTFVPIHQDVVAGPFTEYLVPDTLPSEPHENISHYYERLVVENPRLKQLLGEGPNEDIIRNESLRKGKTIYQEDYCCDEDGFESAKSRARKRVNLPSNWGKIPATTHEASYREPTKIATWQLQVPPAVPQVSSLTPNLKERTILKVCTGDSEYMSRIGDLAKEIMRDQLHGEHELIQDCKKYKQIVDRNKN